MRSHPWYLWRRQSTPTPTGPAGDLRTLPWRRGYSTPAGGGVTGDYRGFMPWFRYGLQIQGKMCAAISMTIPGATFAMATPGATFAMTTPSASMAISAPGATIALTAPGATIELEDCT